MNFQPHSHEMLKTFPMVYLNYFKIIFEQFLHGHWLHFVQVTHEEVFHPSSNKFFPGMIPQRLQQLQCDLSKILRARNVPYSITDIMTGPWACSWVKNLSSKFRNIVCWLGVVPIFSAKTPYLRLSSPLKFCRVLTSRHEPTPRSLQNASRQTWTPAGNLGIQQAWAFRHSSWQYISTTNSNKYTLKNGKTLNSNLEWTSSSSVLKLGSQIHFQNQRRNLKKCYLIPGRLHNPMPYVGSPTGMCPGQPCSKTKMLGKPCKPLQN